MLIHEKVAIRCEACSLPPEQKNHDRCDGAVHYHREYQTTNDGDLGSMDMSHGLCCGAMNNAYTCLDTVMKYNVVLDPKAKTVE